MNNRTAIKDLDSGETEESLFNIINKKENLSEIKVKTNEINAESVEENFLVRDQKPWYFSNGNILPTVQNKSRLYPEDLPSSDRITQQLMYTREENFSGPHKKILMWNGMVSWGGVDTGQQEFIKQGCPVNRCEIVTDRTEAGQADLILFKDHFYSRPNVPRNPDQIWMIYMLECPHHTARLSDKSMFNWTATYRRDSTIVTPYESWQYYDDTKINRPQNINYALNKTKKVAWFVSNCGARNGRLQYAQELSQYISVDIYGSCGTLKCSRNNAQQCFQMLDTDYKFYLAFENSNCRDYITEKFFVNGLGHKVLPIVMGARPEDYEKVAPKKSYIHVDEFKGPKELAEYLHELDQDDDKYNQYFQWKGTGEFINTRFFCRVCSMLHYPQMRAAEYNHYDDINNWWRGDGVCSDAGWRLTRELKDEKREQEEKKVHLKQQEMLKQP